MPIYYESQERLDKAADLYKDVFILRPNYAQSYMNIANSFRDIGRVKQAAALYARYNYLVEEGLLMGDERGFKPIFQREGNNLLYLHKNKIVRQDKVKSLFVFEEDFKGTRLVFEWNDGEAEFELQFVNPGNQYYTPGSIP